jgi:prenyltransferase beta subunit
MSRERFQLALVKYFLNASKFLFSFLSSVVCGEKDMRFVYCAVVICYILNDFSFIDVDKAVEFIISSAVSMSDFSSSLINQNKCISNIFFFCISITMEVLL